MANRIDSINLTTAQIAGLKSAALRDVGTTSDDQIPDMSSQGVGISGTTGWQRFPDGMIRQWGISGPVTGSGANTAVAFPIQFPNYCLDIKLTPISEGVPAVSLFMHSSETRTGFTVWGVARITAAGPAISAIPNGTQTKWEAWGK